MTHIQAVIDLIRNNSGSNIDDLRHDINIQFEGYENDADVLRKTKKLLDLYDEILRIFNYDQIKIDTFIISVVNNYNMRFRKPYGAKEFNDFYDLLTELLFDLRLPSLQELKDERLSVIGNTLNMNFLAP